MRHEKDSQKEFDCRAPMQPLFLKGLLSLWSPRKHFIASCLRLQRLRPTLSSFRKTGTQDSVALLQTSLNHS